MAADDAGGGLTTDEARRQAGLDPELARRMWQALGFPVEPDEEARLGPEDVEALRLGALLWQSGVVDEELLVHQTRVVAGAAARVAESQAAALAERVGDDIRDPATLAYLDEQLAPTVAWLLGYLYRRHLGLAIERTALAGGADGATATATIGFADLVGFTARTRDLPPTGLARLVDAFEGRTHDLVTGSGGRVVKTIGDEVLFLVDDPVQGCEIGLALLAWAGGEDSPGDLRIGLATGPVLHRWGDVFGPTVNLAARLTEVAYAGTCLLDHPTAEAAEAAGRFGVRHLHERTVRGIGRVRPASLRAPA